MLVSALFCLASCASLTVLASGSEDKGPFDFSALPQELQAKIISELPNDVNNLRHVSHAVRDRTEEAVRMMFPEGISLIAALPRNVQVNILRDMPQGIRELRHVSQGVRHAAEASIPFLPPKDIASLIFSYIRGLRSASEAIRIMSKIGGMNQPEKCRAVAREFMQQIQKSGCQERFEPVYREVFENPEHLSNAFIVEVFALECARFYGLSHLGQKKSMQKIVLLLAYVNNPVYSEGVKQVVRIFAEETLVLIEDIVLADMNDDWTNIAALFEAEIAKVPSSIF